MIHHPENPLTKEQKNTSTTRAQKHIAIYVPSLSGGGAERCMLSLAEDFACRGFRVDLVLNRKRGPYIEKIDKNIKVVELKQFPARWRFRARLLAIKAQPAALAAPALPVLLARKPIMDLNYLPALASYLRRECPDALVSALTQANLISVWARRLARVTTRVVVSEHTTLSRRVAEELSRSARQWRWRFLPRLVRHCYPQADEIVAVSDGVAEDLADTTGIASASVERIYNPAVPRKLAEAAAESLDHPWFSAGEPPVVLAIGKLAPGKEFASLIRAFARLRAGRRARLIVLGDGEERERLQAHIAFLGIEQDVQLLGWVDNPYKYLARAGIFASSSRYEGLPTVLIEAMACGCPVVSTDCPSGPREILDHGKYGMLVPVGDAGAMAEAMGSALESPRNSETLKRRAAGFSVRASADQYLKLAFPSERARDYLSEVEPDTGTFAAGIQR